MLDRVAGALDAAGRISRLLAATRITLSDEKAAQAEIATALLGAGIEHKREHALSRRDRPDFLLACGLVIEVKLRANKMHIWRQLSRYAQHPQVLALMLVSNTAMALPPTVNGKPLSFLSLGRSWL